MRTTTRPARSSAYPKGRRERQNPSASVAILEQASQVVREATAASVDWAHDPKSVEESFIRATWLEKQLEKIRAGDISGFNAIREELYAVRNPRAIPNLDGWPYDGADDIEDAFGVAVDLVYKQVLEGANDRLARRRIEYQEIMGRIGTPTKPTKRPGGTRQ
jgi:hypothetical protein